jgi:predicted lipid-binding transport protein (Tim44 family)
MAGGLIGLVLGGMVGMMVGKGLTVLVTAAIIGLLAGLVIGGVVGLFCVSLAQRPQQQRGGYDYDDRPTINFRPTNVNRL